jgi:predicted ATP-dependent endonuclease of OLD family
MTIHGIKGIDHGIIEMPIENGLYAIVGKNGTGKSTIMSCFSQIISKEGLNRALKQKDYSSDSYIEYSYDEHKDIWRPQDGVWTTKAPSVRFNGMFEGSLFYGFRFRDSKIVDDLLVSGKIEEQDIELAADFIVEQMGIILHDEPSHYSGIKKIRNKEIAVRLGLSNSPYFQKTPYSLISQYRMSSGECLLLSLLHFIYHSLVRRTLPESEPILMLIDEIELALHPIAVKNLLDLLEEQTKKHDNLTVILTSHSPEVIRRISPQNMFNLERVANPQNNFYIVNPCYPNYAIRDVYLADGPDFLILVEDILAKLIVQKSIAEMNLKKSRIINVIPIGGWQNVLDFQKELLTHNVLGAGKRVICVLDGDIQSKHNAKIFLPIPSIEKYLRDILFVNPNPPIRKLIGDNFFQVESLQSLVNEYRSIEFQNKKNQDALGKKFSEDNDGKRLYKHLLKNLAKYKISEGDFVSGLYEIILEDSGIDFTRFKKTLQEIVS